jgi:fimbrial chaperone protein
MHHRPAACRSAHFLRRRLLALFLLAACANAPAGNFHISPILAEVPPGKTSATYRLRNTGDRPLTIQIDAWYWLQRDNNDLHVDNRSLMVVPPLATIEPGRTQIVRIALRKKRPERELAYRVTFHEVPSAPPEGFIGVQTVLKFEVPLFFAAAEPTRKLDWRLDRGPGGKLRVSVHNRGTRFARFSRLSLGERRIAQVEGPLYVLPGAQRYWTLEGNADTSRTRSFTLTIESGTDSEKKLLTLR